MLEINYYYYYYFNFGRKNVHWSKNVKILYFSIITMPNYNCGIEKMPFCIGYAFRSNSFLLLFLSNVILLKCFRMMLRAQFLSTTCSQLSTSLSISLLSLWGPLTLWSQSRERWKKMWGVVSKWITRKLKLENYTKLWMLEKKNYKC